MWGVCGREVGVGGREVGVGNRKFRRARREATRKTEREAGTGGPVWPLNRFIICRLLMAGKRPQLEALPVPAKCLTENPICAGLWEQKLHVNN